MAWPPWASNAPPLLGNGPRFCATAPQRPPLCVRNMPPSFLVDSPTTPYPFLVSPTMACAFVPELLLVTLSACALPLIVSFVVCDAVLLVRPISRDFPSAASAVPSFASTAPPRRTAPPVSRARRDRSVLSDMYFPVGCNDVDCSELALLYPGEGPLTGGGA